MKISLPFQALGWRGGRRDLLIFRSCHYAEIVFQVVSYSWAHAYSVSSPGSVLDPTATERKDRIKDKDQ